MPQDTCLVPDCGRTPAHRGYCPTCYHRLRRSGELELLPRSDAVQRFWAKVDKNGPIPCLVPHLGPCWMWMAHLDAKGYGQLSSVAIGNWKAHRFAYEQIHGPIPAGLEPDHLCRNRACVNPDHIELVVHRENILRSNGPAAINARKTHCKRGHAFDEANTFLDSRGSRQCRVCRLASYVKFHRNDGGMSLDEIAGSLIP